MGMGMGMIGFWNKHWWWMALPILIAGIAFAYVSPALDHGFFCKGESSCFREWVGTLSTLLAMVAAAIAAYFVYGQLDEQRRQTAFLLGDGLPTLESVRTGGKSTSGQVLLLNWNRRTLLIKRVEIRSSLPTPKPTKMRFTEFREDKMQNEIVDIGPDGALVPSSMRIPGYIDRTSGPQRHDITFLFDRTIEDYIDITNHAETRVNLVFHCVFTGDLTHIFEVGTLIPCWGLFPNQKGHHE